MLFNFLSFLTHTAHTEKADDKAKRDEDNRRHHKQKTYLCQDLKIELIERRGHCKQTPQMQTTATFDTLPPVFNTKYPFILKNTHHIGIFILWY